MPQRHHSHGHRGSSSLAFPEAENVRNFSGLGDSGAAVMDRAGEVMGMRIGEQGYTWPFSSGQGVDLTFVTPIEAILEDLERAGFEQPTIAPCDLY